MRVKRSVKRFESLLHPSPIAKDLEHTDPGRRFANGKSSHYAWLMGYQCANPNCRYGFGPEGHHVRPKGRGGEDAYWNLICLCVQCHRTRHLHRNWRNKALVLYTWKCSQELQAFGFTLDENEVGFQHRLQLARKMRREENPDMPEPDAPGSLERGDRKVALSGEGRFSIVQPAQRQGP